MVSITDKYRIEGSSDIEKLVEYGDIDLLDIAKEKTPNEILTHFTHVFEEIKKNDRSVITDLKYGKKNGVALRWTTKDLKKDKLKGITFRDP